MLALSVTIAAAALAGFSRGYAAFGAAMIYVPPVALAYDARTAVVTLFLVDLVPSVPLIWRAAPQCDKSTILWMSVGALALTPVGVALLLVADATQIELVMGVILMAAASYMLRQRSFRMSGAPLMSVGAGAVSGLAGGLCGIFGPPALIYLLGRSADARRSRADTMVYLTGQSLILGLTYLIYGMYTLWSLELSLLLLPVYGFFAWVGANCFSHTSEAAYRRAILALLLAVSAFLVAKAALALAG